MKQLGNLAIICAKREDTVLMIVNGIVHILVFDDEGYNIGNFRVNWDVKKRAMRSQRYPSCWKYWK